MEDIQIDSNSVAESFSLAEGEDRTENIQIKKKALKLESSFLTDEFMLNSSNEFNLKSGSEKSVSLSLQKVPQPPETKLIGKVVENYGPVIGAVVQVLDKKNKPVERTFSDTEGDFHFINKLAAGKYSIIAAAPNRKISKKYKVHIRSNRETRLEIELSQGNLSNEGTIYGIVKDKKGRTLSGTKLFVMEKWRPHVRKAVTISNTDGDYMIYGLKPGKYLLTAEKEGYELHEPIEFELLYRQISNVDITLKELVTSGTICGKIIYRRKPIPNAIVALYRIDGHIQSLVRMTEANEEGMYLFGSVPPGRYYITAKVETMADRPPH